MKERPNQNRNAQRTVERLSQKVTLSPAQEARLKEARKITRRDFLKKTAKVAGGLVLAGTAYGFAESLLGKDEKSNAEIIKGYEDAFWSVANGNPAAEELYAFYRERKRLASISNGDVFADEEGSQDRNFWVVVNHTAPGSASYDNNTNLLSLRPIELTDIWKGVLLAHETSHIHDDLAGIEQPGMESFYQGEVRAYNLEFDLLNQATDGAYKRVLHKLLQANPIPEGQYQIGLFNEQYDALTDLFPQALSQDELKLRVAAFTIAINFAAFELRSEPSAFEAKTDYIAALYSGELPILPPGQFE